MSVPPPNSVRGFSGRAFESTLVENSRPPVEVAAGAAAAVVGRNALASPQGIPSTVKLARMATTAAMRTIMIFLPTRSARLPITEG